MIALAVLVVSFLGFYRLGYLMGVRSRRAKIIDDTYLENFDHMRPQTSQIQIVDPSDPLDIDLH